MSRTLPGHTIPYELSPSEAADFIARNRLNPILSNYLHTNDPPYGIIVDDNYSQILVWYDQSFEPDSLHVIDVTNMAVAQAVKQAPYQSPDEGFINNLLDELKSIASGLGKGIQIGTSTVILMLGVLWAITRRTR